MATHMRTVKVEDTLDIQNGALIIPIVPMPNAPTKPQTGSIRWNAQLRALQVFDGQWLTIARAITPKPEKEQ